MNAQKIEKEEIVKLHFLPTDIVKNEIKKREIIQQLHLGAQLGNLEKRKCKIVFHAQEGDMYVETTIWAVTDKCICLKGGLFLLIASILEVVL
jgi:hypothetical protein